MAEYYAVLSKAVAALEASTGEARRAVYDKARSALIGQLKAIDPPLPTAEISRQRLELEEAIRRVEREAANQPPAAADAAARTATQPARSAPQDVFRRAIQDAGSRGAGEPPPIERAPATVRTGSDGAAAGDGRPGARIERAPPPPPTPYTPPRGHADRPNAAAEPRLAPDYGWEPEAPAPRYQQGSYADHRERPAERGRRRQGADDNPELMERRARPSRLPAILLLVLIVVMAGGLAALGWSQRAVLSDLLTWFDSGTAEAPPAPATASNATDGPAAASNKNPDRLPTGAPRDTAVRVVDASPSTGDGATVETAAPPAVAALPPLAQPDAGAVVAQKAVLYEEPLDAAAAAAGVVAIDATVTWSFVAASADGPEITADIDVPGRNMNVKLAIRQNRDASLPASHLVEVVIDTPADFPGKSIKNVPRLVLKDSETAARGQPLIGATATITEGFFWIALSGVASDVTANLAMLRDRGWIDLPLVYETGQRAILTVEKGTPGQRVFEEALAAWTQ